MLILFGFLKQAEERKTRKKAREISTTTYTSYTQGILLGFFVYNKRPITAQYGENVFADCKISFL